MPAVNKGKEVDGVVDKAAEDKLKEMAKEFKH